jgi:hypothetical protein
MSIVGTVHQFGWMKGSDKPWRVVKRGGDIPSGSLMIMMVEGSASDILSEFPGMKIQELRNAIRVHSRFQGKKLSTVLKTFHVFIVANRQGNYRGTIVWPRTESQGIPFNISIALDMHSEDIILQRLNMNELDNVLNRYGKNRVAL